jgi:hypothetical protein
MCSRVHGQSKKNEDGLGGAFLLQTGELCLHARSDLFQLLTHICRLVSIGGQGHIMNGQEPKKDDPLPVNDFAWVSSLLSIFLQS